MGWLGDLLGGIGDVAKYAAIPIGLTGVGAPIAAGIGAAGGALGKLNDEPGDRGLGSILGSAAGGAAMGGLGGFAGKALAGSDLVAQVVKALGPEATPEQIAEKVAQMKASGLGGSALNGLGSLVKSDPMKALQLGGAGLSAIEGSRQQSKINKRIEEELERIRAQEDSRLPYQDMLRERLEGQMGDSGRLGAIYGQSQNPFAQGQIPPEILGQLSGATQPTAPMRPYQGGVNYPNPYGGRP